jgi:hypothetical protein
MEYWVFKADDGLILISDECHLYKNGSRTANPSILTFHYSSTPWHLIMAGPIISYLAQRIRFSILE